MPLRTPVSVIHIDITRGIRLPPARDGDGGGAIKS